MRFSGVSRRWQILSAGISYFLFGLSALVVGLFFRLLAPVPLISSATKQRWIRNCIQKGCHTFIRIMRGFGLIRYSFDVDSMLRAERGHIVIANHPSLIDVVLLLAVNKQMCCFVKRAVWDSFFTGAVVRQAGFIPNSGEQVLKMAAKKLQAGESILIFPEGTRTKADNIVHFKRGAASMAVAMNAPIMPVFINCYPRALKKGDKWYDIPAGGPVFFINSGPSLKVEECIDTEKPKPLQYRQLTQYLERYYQHWLETGSPGPPILPDSNDVAEKL